MWYWFRLFQPLSLIIILQLSIFSNAENKKRPFNNSIPAIFVFGDSTVDPGNNNYWKTLFKANFPPYGMDFVNHIPTGRFTNGRLVTDFIASYGGIKEYVPPYLDPTLNLEELLTGVSFASASSGFDPLTPILSSVISMQKQLNFFKEYKTRLELAIGKERTKILINKSVFIISAGTNDFIVNYYGTPFRRRTFTVSGYQQFLLQHVQDFVQGLLDQGGRTIAFVGLPPMGCLPVVITLNSGNAFHSRGCSESLSSVAVDYNQKLQIKLKAMESHGIRIIYADIYKPLDGMTKNPSKFGFEEVHSGCCGSGYIEASILCNPTSPVCYDASKYVFFDSVHPTEAAYYYIFKALRPTIDQVLNN
ncbi:GDSL esterase/lipase [Abeliophyllum distichum]|uniref:GDSL esterase/lipase n=1 Tax=Abeliophyllum distichum TaxID=126358 RepID=A0ABD1QGD1_9LAMI